jgi:two-component system, chemotaxis family, chemotaxis protein CheY
MRMLIIDDSRAMRRLLSGFGQTLGFETSEAEDGEKALEAVMTQPRFDVALVDWDMPVMNGLEFIQNIRANPAFNYLKLMMVTAQTSPEYLVKALENGADDYLMKPLTQEMFDDKLRVLGFVP